MSLWTTMHRVAVKPAMPRLKSLGRLNVNDLQLSIVVRGDEANDDSSVNVITAILISGPMFPTPHNVEDGNRVPSPAPFAAHSGVCLDS